MTKTIETEMRQLGVDDQITLAPYQRIVGSHLYEDPEGNIYIVYVIETEEN